MLSVEGPDGDRPQVRCEVTVGCEGSKSPVAAGMTSARVSEQSLPARWLALLGARRHWKTTPSMPRIRAGSPGRCAAARTRRGTCWRSASLVTWLPGASSPVRHGRRAVPIAQEKVTE